MLVAVGLAPHALPPRHLAGVEAQVGAADPVILVVLGLAQAREEAVGLVGAGAVVAEREAVDINGKNIGYDDIITTFGDAMAGERDWTAYVKGVLKAELKRRNVGYRELAEKLGALGIHETERNIANKISHGGFTAAFLVQCLVAVGCHALRLDDG